MHDPYLSYPYVWLHVCTPAIGFPPLVVNLWTPSWHFGPALSWQVWGFLQEGFGSALAAPAVSLSRNGALCLQPFAGRVWCCIYCRHPAWEGVELLADAALICFILSTMLIAFEDLWASDLVDVRNQGIEGMFQDMEISKVLAEVFDSSAEAKDILEDMGLLTLCPGCQSCFYCVRNFTGIPRNKNQRFPSLPRGFSHGVHEFRQDLGVDFHVSVLTTGRWPSPPPSCEIQLPLPLQRLATEVWEGEITMATMVYGINHKCRYKP